MFTCTFAGSPPTTDTGVESSEDTTEPPEDKSVEGDDEQQQHHASDASELNLEPSALLAHDSSTGPPTCPKTAESADTTQTEPVEDTTMPAEDQSKGQSSPTITAPLAKPSHLSAESAETASAKGTKDNYVVSIPLSLVRLSRKSKSRSSSKDLGGK